MSVYDDYENPKQRKAAVPRGESVQPGSPLPFKIDRDTLLTAALLFLLLKEGADMKLILALGYILLEV